MQIKPAILASPGKSVPGHGGNDHSEADDSLHAFGAVLGNAMQVKDADKRDIAPSRQPDQRNEHAATPATPGGAGTPAMPAHAAAQAEDDEQLAKDEAAPAEGQLEGGLQAFVNSLQTPFTATATPASAASTAAHVAADAAADAATDPAADGVAALATDAAGHGRGKTRALAPGLDDSQGQRSRTQLEADLGVTADAMADASSTDGVTDGVTDGGKLDTRDPHAALRAQDIAASKVIPEFRAALNDAQATRPGLQEALAGDNGSSSSNSSSSSGSALTNAIAAVATVATVASAAAGTPPASGAHAAAARAGHVAPHLHAPHWQDAFGQQVLWMAKSEQQIASLTMNPPDLGPVRVTLSVSDGQASAAFVSLQPEVRQAIQDAVPRLKEMLADAGLQLQQASVDSGDAGRPSASNAQGEDGTRRVRSAGSATDADAAAMTTDAASLRTARSIAASRLVDLFA